MKRISPFLALGFSILVCHVSVAAQATHAQFTRWYENYEWVLDNPCTGESVTYTVDGIDITRTTFPPAGEGVHQIIHQNLHGTGVGATTGETYRFNYVFNQSFQDNVPHASRFGLHLRTRQNAPGPTAEAVFNWTWRLVTNANGETVVVVESETSECR